METVVLGITAICISLFTLAIGVLSLNRLQDKQESVNKNVRDNLHKLRELTEEIRNGKK